MPGGSPRQSPTLLPLPRRRLAEPDGTVAPARRLALASWTSTETCNAEPATHTLRQTGGGTLLKRICAFAAAGVAALGLAFGLAPQRDIATEIAIAAPPARVWAILTDTDAYPEWNPQTALTGNLAPGSVIENRVGHGREQQVFRPTVLVARTGQELRWRGRILVPRLFDAEHYFLLRPQGAATIFTQGEHVRGVALWFLDVAELVPGFQAMNAALKARAERNEPWAPAGPPATLH